MPTAPDNSIPPAQKFAGEGREGLSGSLTIKGGWGKEKSNSKKQISKMRYPGAPG